MSNPSLEIRVGANNHSRSCCLSRSTLKHTYKRKVSVLPRDILDRKSTRLSKSGRHSPPSLMRIQTQTHIHRRNLPGPFIHTSRIVSNPHTRVHVLPMRNLSATSYAGETGLNSTFISRGHAVVFRPTGWTFGRGERSLRGYGAVCYQVAYSEQSSFAELVNFVAWSRAYRMVATVNARDRKSAEALKNPFYFRERKLRQCQRRFIYPKSLCSEEAWPMWRRLWQR